MGFWISMMIVSLVIPFTMIGFGKYFIKNAGVKGINMTFGYRTPMSVKNNDTWRFAHIYVGKLWRVAGWAMIPFSVAVMVFVIGKDINTVGWFSAALTGVQIVFLVLPIIPTEITLRKNFDNNGIRKK